MKLGVLIYMNKDIDREFQKVRDLGLDTCQLCCWDHSIMDELHANEVNNAKEKYGVEITAFWLLKEQLNGLPLPLSFLAQNPSIGELSKTTILSSSGVNLSLTTF